MTFSKLFSKKSYSLREHQIYYFSSTYSHSIWCDLHRWLSPIWWNNQTLILLVVLANFRVRSINIFRLKTPYDSVDRNKPSDCQFSTILRISPYNKKDTSSISDHCGFHGVFFIAKRLWWKYNHRYSPYPI